MTDLSHSDIRDTEFLCDSPTCPGQHPVSLMIVFAIRTASASGISGRRELNGEK
jgi:hypothetical protein